MKYIRTKDGRIIDTSNFVVKREIYENGELKFYQFLTTRFADRQVVELFANEIIKQADTIEELCDEFVAVNIKYNSHHLTKIRREKYYEPKIPMYYAGEHTHDFVDDYIKNKGLIYGAIWTDKGLIYVAKMNEKGELELL